MQSFLVIQRQAPRSSLTSNGAARQGRRMGRLNIPAVQGPIRYFTLVSM